MRSADKTRITVGVSLSPNAQSKVAFASSRRGRTFSDQMRFWLALMLRALQKNPRLYTALQAPDHSRKPNSGNREINVSLSCEEYGFAKKLAEMFDLRPAVVLRILLWEASVLEEEAMRWSDRRRSVVEKVFSELQLRSLKIM